MILALVAGLGLTVLWWSLIAIGALGSFLASGIELGCYSLNRVRLMLRIGVPGDRSARLIKGELDKPDRLMATLVLANVAFSAFITNGVHGLMRGEAELRIVLVNVLVVAPLMFVLCEAIPKELFRVDADRLIYPFALPLTAFRSLLTYTGVMPIVMAAARIIERLVGFGTQGEHLSDARQRMALLLKEGGSGGVLSESQSSLIDRALTFRSTLIGDEMIPWAQVRTISIDWDRAKMVRVAAAQASSRLPVVDSKGRVLGVLRQIDLHTFPDVPIESLLRRPAMLSPSMGVLEALRRIRGADAPLGIVEHDARPIGLVTAKDLVEPLTGELPDW
jgi:putative hemolysin